MDLWREGDRVFLRGVFQTGTEGPTVSVPVGDFERALRDPQHVTLPCDQFALEIDPRGAETYFWIHGWGDNGWSIYYRTAEVLTALDREGVVGA